MMATFKRRNPRSVETLEGRLLLAGDLIANWVADDLVNEANITRWTDQVTGLAVDAHGTPEAIPDRFGGRATLRLDPSDDADYFRLRPNDNPLPEGDFSVAVAFVASGPVSGDGGEWFTNTGLVDANMLGFGEDWGVSLAPSGQISVGAGAGFGQPPTSLYSDVSTLNDGELHVALLTRTGSTLAIYVDDALAGTTDDASVAPRIQRDVTFGILQNDRNPLAGELAQVRFYNGALTADEAVAELESIRGYYNNSPPVAVDDSYSLAEDSLVFARQAQDGLLQNDFDVDGESFTAERVTDAAHGSVVVNPNGSFAYSPSSDFFGTDSFTYLVRNGQVSNVATVTLQVENVYDPVVGRPDEYKLLPGQALQVDAADGVLANDENPDQAAMMVELVEAPAAGQLDLSADGSFVYAPNGFAGRTSFTYQVNDGTSVSNPTEVILLVNSPPQAVADQFTATEDQPLVLTVADGVLKNDTDAENDPLAITIVAEPQNGSLTMEEDGSLVYLPAADYHGGDSFFYQVNDGIDDSGVAIVAIQVLPVNDVPSASDNVYFVAQAQELVVDDPLQGVLGNDSDIDQSDTLSVRLLDGPSNGTVQLAADGTFSYLPADEFQGIDTFSYVANDGEADSNAATVQVFVDVAPVRISEVMVANVDQLTTNLREEPDDSFRSRNEFAPDWIEIQNNVAADFDIGGFFLSDDVEDTTKWQVPAGTVIPANGYMIVFASGRDITNVLLDENSSLHTNFSLNIRNEEILLAFPDGRIADQIEPRIHYPNTSFGIDATGQLGHLAEATPGSDNLAGTLTLLQPVEFSVQRGVYDAPFDVEIVSVDPNTQIRFTLDGSEPGQDNGELYTGPIRVETTTTLRAVAMADNSLSGDIITQTYLFLNDVLEQEELPADYPRSWAGMTASYGMDPDVIGEANLFDDRYRDSIVEDLKSLPSLSLVFDRDNLFGSDGIYQNPLRSGDDWERATSVEFFDPLGNEAGFHINSGIRVMGGSSRQPDIPKHSLRLEFREDYGWGSLEYPFYESVPFGEGATSSFDELVVRTGFNNSWMHRHYYQGERGEQPRDQWVRDLQFATGHASTRGRFVHVYLNGMYWGIYNIQERPAAPHLAEYFGGNSDTDWDVINSGQAIDGSVASWSALHRLARDADEPEVFEQLKQEVDMVNLADYMLLNFYVGNTDWDGHNWIAAKQAGEPYRMYAWDSEFAISLPPSNSAIGENAEQQILAVNRTNQNSANNPSGLHRLLLRSDEYRTLFGDRVHKHMFNDGVMTPEVSTDLFLARSLEVDRAVVAESARWGDFRRDVSAGRWRPDQFDLYTRDEHFLAQKEFIVDRYLPVRTEIVIDQLRRGNQYPDVPAPVLSQHGGRVEKNFELVFTDADAEPIYFTLDGTDPRRLGGDLDAAAIRYTEPIVLSENVTLKARRLVDGDWSALTEADFQAATPASAANLRISELHYHPGDPSPEELAAGVTESDEFEFVELVNTSDEAIDLTDVRFVRQEVDGDLQGLDFDFSTSPINQLAPQQRVVVVENLTAFAVRYGESVTVAGQWSGGLSNGGEQLTLIAGEETIHQFTYDDGWHPSTDGGGASLESVNPAAADLAAWGQAAGWVASFTTEGTPGNADRMPGDVNGDGIFNSSDLTIVFQVGEYEDGVANNSTFEEGDWNGDGEFDTRDLVLVFELGLFVPAAQPIFTTTHDRNLIAAARDADELFGDEKLIDEAFEVELPLL